MLQRKTILTALLALATACWLTSAWAQTGKKKVEEVEEKPAAKKPAAEKPADKPDTAKPGKDEEEEVRPKKPGGAGAPVNIAEEAKHAPHPKIKEVFEKLAVKCDHVTTTGGTTIEVEPLKKRFDPAEQRQIETKHLKDGRERKYERANVASVTHWEFRALDAAKALRDSGLDKADASGKVAVPRSKLLKYAEMLASEALRFHADSKEKRVRTDGWLGLEDEMKKDLLQIQIAQVLATTAEADWDGGEALAAQLRTLYPPTRDLMDAIERHYVAMAEALMEKGEHANARKRLEFFLKKYSTGTPASVEAVHKRLQERARQLLNESKALGDEDSGTALGILQRAQDIWPTLAGLPDERARHVRNRPVLRVGVRQLPKEISPTTALTDVDHAACQLVFDTLFRLRSAPTARDGYECKLGLEIRSAGQGGLELVLPQDLKWSDGRPFTTDDVLRSKEIMLDRRSPYFDPLAAELIKDMPVQDDYHVSVEFKRGHLDLFSFLTFPLLPVHRLARERSPRDPAFGKTPVGTGPYMFKGVEGNEAVFVINPRYRRPHVPSGPNLQEIRFVQYSDFEQAKQAITNGSWQIIFDLTSKEREAMEGVSAAAVMTPTRPREGGPAVLTNPRLCVLMPNHRTTLGNADLRKAISMSLDREAILNAVFRGRDGKDHQTLSGPYPLGSWAFNPAFTPAKSPPYKPAVAKGHLTAAQAKLPNIPALSLRFPNDDPQAAEACKLIGTQLAQVGIPIKLDPAARDQIARDLTTDRPTFDLIYMNVDFPNETLDLWPLMDPQSVSPNGRNYMGFLSDPEVPAAFRLIQAKRELDSVKLMTHGLHDRLIEQNMAFIPLWQLDHHVAVHKSLQITRLHPLFVFDDVEEWRLEFGK